jgi:hypothetical protein
MGNKDWTYAGLYAFLAVFCSAVGIDVFYRDPETGTGRIMQMVQEMRHRDLKTYDISGTGWCLKCPHKVPLGMEYTHMYSLVEDMRQTHDLENGLVLLLYFGIDESMPLDYFVQGDLPENAGGLPLTIHGVPARDLWAYSLRQGTEFLRSMNGDETIKRAIELREQMSEIDSGPEQITPR